MMRIASPAVLVAALMGLFGPQADSGLQITHRARAVAPGEIVVVDVRAKAPLKEVRADWMKQSLIFYELTPDHWQGLAPIDLGAKSGPQTLGVHALGTDGKSLTRNYPMTIAARIFPARRITVDPKFVDPPADQLPRIEKERQAAEALFVHTTAERYWSRPFVVPVPGNSTSAFGRRSIVNGQPRGQHSGADFQAPAGTPVVAPNRGRVALVADQYFSGNTIIIDHGLGLYSYLAHLSEFLVKEGDMVERGQRIARSGSTGRVTGPHLHWTLRLGSARIDPVSLVTVLEEEAKGATRELLPF